MYKNKKYRSGSIISQQNSKIRKIVEETEQNENMFNCSQDTVLPSQAPSQRRYFSQRSNLTGTDSSRSIKRIPASYYESMLIKCGADLSNPDCVLLDDDHISFVNKLRNILKSNAEYPENIKVFIIGFKDFIKDESNLLKLMTGCQITVNKNDQTIIQSQENIIKNFLMVDFMQNELIDILIDKIKSIITDNENSNISIINLILSQLKFIDHVSNGEKLFQKVFELLSLADRNLRSEIICCLEDVIDISLHDETVRKLMDLLPDDKELLTPSNLDTFGNMCLSSDLCSKLRYRATQYLKSNLNISEFPSLINFFLKFSNEEHDKLPNIVDDLRSNLVWNFNDASQTEIDNSQLEIFASVKQSLIRSRKLFDIWLKCIHNLSDPMEHKPIDLVILIIMISINDEKTVAISNFIKRKVKLNHLTLKILETSMKNYQIIFGNYTKYMLELVESFLRDRDYNIIEFGFTVYKLSFGIKNCDQKLILSKLLRLVCVKQSTIACCGREPVDVSTNALLLLTEMNKEYATEIQNNGRQLFKILDRISDLNLTQYRMAMNILCSVAYPDLSDLQDHLAMFVRKQISSSVLSTKRQGVVGAIRLLEHVAYGVNNQDLGNESFDSDQTFNSIHDLPIGKGRDAAEIFELILSSTNNCFTSLGLCFDELATVFSLKNKNTKKSLLDKNFLIWMSDALTSDFYKDFIIEGLPENPKMLMDYLFCLNLPEENENSENDIYSIAVNIGDKTLKNAKNNVISSVSILPAIFNLIRILHVQRYDGNLSGINALPGCSILLPKIFNSETDILDYIEHENNTDNIKSVIDIHIHLANWYRELISAFSSQDEEMIRQKVLKRLSQLVAIQNTINIIINKPPENYKPPICQFFSNASQSFGIKDRKGSFKTSSSKQNENSEKVTDTEGVSILGTMRTQNVTTGNIPNIKKNGRKCFDIYDMDFSMDTLYRQMDYDIIFLLDQKFIIQYPLPKEMEGSAMGVLELKFILNDFVSKVESIQGVKKFISNQKTQQVLFVDVLIKQLIQFSPKIVIFMKQLINYIEEAIKENKNLYSDEINYVKVCLNLCLRLFAALFTLPEFKKNDALLKLSLKSVGNFSIFDSGNEKSVSEISLLALNIFKSYSKVIIDLTGAVHLFHLTKAISAYISQSESNETVVRICEEFLTKSWCGLDGKIETGTRCNILLDELLKGFMKDANLLFIRKIVKIVSLDVKGLKKKAGYLKAFPLFNKQNFPILFRILCSSLVTAINKKVSAGTAIISHLITWENGCNILGLLLEIVQNINIPRNFVLFLKNAHIFLKLFLQYGISMLEINLRVHPERANELLKSLQQTTRFLHNLCCHSKAIKNTTIIAQIPFLRQTIEQLVFRVKAALAANNCSTVFWMGNLKNKDIHGEEILSQISSITTHSESVSDDELPEEEEDEEIEDQLALVENDKSAKDVTSDASTSKFF